MAAERRQEEEQEASEAEGGEEAAAVERSWNEHGIARFRRHEIAFVSAVLLIHHYRACDEMMLIDEG